MIRWATVLVFLTSLILTVFVLFAFSGGVWASSEREHKAVVWRMLTGNETFCVSSVECLDGLYSLLWGELRQKHPGCLEMRGSYAFPRRSEDSAVLIVVRCIRWRETSL